jgi:hypothetical protein
MGDDFVWVDSCDFITSETCPSAAPTIDHVVLARRVRDNLPVPGLSEGRLSITLPKRRDPRAEFHSRW